METLQWLFGSIHCKELDWFRAESIPGAPLQPQTTIIPRMDNSIRLKKIVIHLMPKC